MVLLLEIVGQLGRYFAPPQSSGVFLFDLVYFFLFVVHLYNWFLFNRWDRFKIAM